MRVRVERFFQTDFGEIIGGIDDGKTEQSAQAKKSLCAGKKCKCQTTVGAMYIQKEEKADITRRTRDREREFVTRGAASSTRFRGDRA
jgi:hypothetical protein